MTKRSLTIITAALFTAVTIMLTGCGSEGETPAPKTSATLTAITKDTYGISFKIDGTLYNTEDCFGTYFPDENATSIVAGPEGEGWTLSMGFEGKGTGTFKASGSIIYETLKTFSSANMDITITYYGEIREKIEGTFSGTLTSISDPSSTIEITDGKFTAWRTPFD